MPILPLKPSNYGLYLNMTRKRAIYAAARLLTTLAAVFLIGLSLVAWQHGNLDIVGALRTSLYNTETQLREWFSCLRLR